MAGCGVHRVVFFSLYFDGRQRSKQRRVSFLDGWTDQPNESASTNVYSPLYFSSVRSSPPIGHLLAVRRPCITGIIYGSPPPSPRDIYAPQSIPHCPVIVFQYSRSPSRTIPITHSQPPRLILSLSSTPHPPSHFFPKSHKQTHLPPQQSGHRYISGPSTRFCLFFSGSNRSLSFSRLSSPIAPLGSVPPLSNILPRRPLNAPSIPAISGFSLPTGPALSLLSIHIYLSVPNCILEVNVGWNARYLHRKGSIVSCHGRWLLLGFGPMQ